MAEDNTNNATPIATTNKVVLPTGFRPCGCPASLGMCPISGRTASETLHGMMVTYGGCPMLDMPEELRTQIIASRSKLTVSSEVSKKE